MAIDIDFAGAISVAWIHSSWSKVVAVISTLRYFAWSVTNIWCGEDARGITQTYVEKAHLRKANAVRPSVVSKKEGTIAEEIRITVQRSTSSSSNVTIDKPAIDGGRYSLIIIYLFLIISLKLWTFFLFSKEVWSGIFPLGLVIKHTIPIACKDPFPLRAQTLRSTL